MRCFPVPFLLVFFVKTYSSYPEFLLIQNFIETISQCQLLSSFIQYSHPEGYSDEVSASLSHLLRDDTHMTPMKIVQFLRAPTPCPSSILRFTPPPPAPIDLGRPISDKLSENK